MEENLEKIKKNSSLNKTWLLVTGLIALTGVLLILSLKSNNIIKLPGDKTSVKTDFAHTSLAISEDPRPSTVSGMYEADITIDTDKDDVLGAQLEISYDPSVLTNVDIKPGDFLKNPSTIIKKIDTKTGRITYALAGGTGEKAVKGTGVIAVISFRKTSTEDTVISFLPQTQVASPDINQSVLKNTYSALIGNLSATPESSPLLSPQITGEN